MLGLKGWFRRPKEHLREPEPTRAQIFLSSLSFSDGAQVVLERNSIVILTGPNNVGKSSALREIRDRLQKSKSLGPVTMNLSTCIEGTKADFKGVIEASGLRDSRGEYIMQGYSSYSLNDVDRDFEKHFVGKLPMEFFLSYLGCADRLQLTKPARRKDYKRQAPDHPILWLELDDTLGHKVTDAFSETFGQALVLNVTAGESIEFHVIPQDCIDGMPETIKEFIPWINSFPELESQGDGMRSFTGALLSLLVHPRNIVLVDEPEAFLHPPQARRLAEVIASKIGESSQIIIATHSSEIVRALLNIAENRVTIARITRCGDENHVKVLNNERVKQLWKDALLRTSDVLSALFHGIAIFCEGDSDSRFFEALLETTKGDLRDADRRFSMLAGRTKYR